MTAGGIKPTPPGGRIMGCSGYYTAKMVTQQPGDATSPDGWIIGESGPQGLQESRVSVCAGPWIRLFQKPDMDLPDVGTLSHHCQPFGKE